MEPVEVYELSGKRIERLAKILDHVEYADEGTRDK